MNDKLKIFEDKKVRTHWDEQEEELSDKIGQLKMQANDSKFYKTDVLDTEQLLRLIQSIPSKKAEPMH